jgi:guanylate kinase
MKIIICGKSASGKDELKKRLREKGMKYGKTYTTRPPREGEGEDSHVFISEEQFKKLNTNKFFKYYSVFNGWFYGLPNFEWRDSNLFIFTPSSLQSLTEEELKESFIIYVDIEEDVRRSRLQERKGNADSIERRLKADKEDFENFTKYNLRITNENF